MFISNIFKKEVDIDPDVIKCLNDIRSKRKWNDLYNCENCMITWDTFSKPICFNNSDKIENHENITGHTIYGSTNLVFDLMFIFNRHDNIEGSKIFHELKLKRSRFDNNDDYVYTINNITHHYVNDYIICESEICGEPNYYSSDQQIRYTYEFNIDRYPVYGVISSFPSGGSKVSDKIVKIDSFISDEKCQEYFDKAKNSQETIENGTYQLDLDNDLPCPEGYIMSDKMSIVTYVNDGITMHTDRPRFLKDGKYRLLVYLNNSIDYPHRKNDDEYYGGRLFDVNGLSMNDGFSMRNVKGNAIIFDMNVPHFASKTEGIKRIITGRIN